MNEQKQVQARVIERVRVLNSEKPEVAVVELQVRGGQSEFFAMSRKAMLEVSEHLRKHAQGPSDQNSAETGSIQ